MRNLVEAMAYRNAHYRKSDKRLSRKRHAVRNKNNSKVQVIDSGLKFVTVVAGNRVMTVGKAYPNATETIQNATFSDLAEMAGGVSYRAEWRKSGSPLSFEAWLRENGIRTD